MKKKNDWVFSQANQIMIEKLTLPCPSKVSFEVKKDGALWMTDHLESLPVTFDIGSAHYIITAPSSGIEVRLFRQ